MRHFWQAGKALIKAYRRVLALPADAWDIYFLYRPGRRWKGSDPPTPDFWMHQLRGRVNGPFLDAKVFAHRARRLLNRK